MQLLPENQRTKIRQRAKKIRKIFKNPIANIFVFETIGALILSFGVCVSEKTHPISRGITNPFWGFLICCFNYFAISISGLFTGGHVNPSATIALAASGIVQNPRKKLPAYFASQLIGSIFGALIYFAFFQETTEIYKKDQNFSGIIMDSISEIFGTFIFCFGVLHITKSQYMKGEPFKYFYISLMLFVARMFTFRIGCLNPAVAISFQIFAAARHQNFGLFYSVFGIVIGEIIGALIAAIFYNKFYEPLLIEVEKHQDQQQ